MLIYRTYITSKNFTVYFNDHSFDNKLSQINHYKRYPQMLPLVGSEYQSNLRKIIVIGESHYLPSNSVVHKDAKSWYETGTSDSISAKEKEWTHTRGTAGYAKNQKYNSKGHTIYRNLERAIRVGLNCEEGIDNYFRYIAYYNYFQRPALQGDSLQITQVDEEIGYIVIKELHQILRFDIAIFVSKLAYSSFKESAKQDGSKLGFVVEKTVHPSCSWWNRVHTNWQNGNKVKCTGKDQFIHIVSMNYE